MDQMAALSLSLLNWPPLISSVPNIRGWNYLPGAEARGSLGPVPIGLCATLINSPSNISLIFSGYSSHLILPPSVLSYPTISLPLIPVSPYPHPYLMLHVPLLSLGYPDRDAPTTSVRVTFLASAPPPDTSP